MSEQQAEPAKPRNVVEAVLSVKRQIDAMGVGKDKKVQDGPAKYAYRSVDDVINAISVMLTRAGIITTITYHDHNAEDVTIVGVKGPRTAHRVSCLQRVRFWHSNDDGNITHLDTEALGEGLDNGDKATNKAMSVAYKYALGLSLPIPFVGRDDPDAEQPVLAGPAENKHAGPAVDVPTYMTRIAQCQDVNVLRGIVRAGIDEAKAAGDREAQARIMQAGKDRAAMLTPEPPPETVTQDGEVV